MKKIIIILSFLISYLYGTSAGTSAELNKMVFNPKDVWQYRYVNTSEPWMIEDMDAFYDISYGHLQITGNKIIDDDSYYCAQWKWDKESPESGPTFLLREEEGAYYTYITYMESEDPSFPGDTDYRIPPGKYLVYDFNMKPGDCFEAPYALNNILRYGNFYPEYMGLCRFTVIGVSKDESERRVLDLKCEGISPEIGMIPEVIRIIEGVGVLENGNIAMYIFTDGMEWGWLPRIELYGVQKSDNRPIYLNSMDSSAGFIKEKDYTWIYAQVTKNGAVFFRKMGFNYFFKAYTDSSDKISIYRRFGTLGTADCFDGEWEKADFDRYLVREQDGEVWLCHEKDEMNIGFQSDKTPYISLIYDFNATDGQTLDFYTTDGFRSLTVKTGMTEVNGEETPDYQFEGTDGIKCVQGLGIVKGGILPCINTEFRRANDNSMANAQLVAVFDGDGNLIFRQDLPDFIRTIGEEAGDFLLPTDRLFDLQGRELKELVPGMPYIKDGKVLVAPK